MPLRTKHDVCDVKSAANEFAFDFYRTFLIRHPEKYCNLFYSPFIVFTSFAAVLAGAKDQTKKELMKLLRLPDFDVDVTALKELRHLNDTLLKANRHFIFYGSFFYIDSSIEVKPNFTVTLRDEFELKPKKLKFATEKPDDLTKMINKDTEEATERTISELINVTMLKPEIKLFIANAALFRGYWVQEFNKIKKDGRFVMLKPDGSRQEVKTTMMSTTAIFNFSYSSEMNCKILQLPYDSSELSMICVLPDGVLTGLDILRDYNKTNFMQLLDTMMPSEVEVVMPKFGLDPNNLPIKGTIEQMGAKSLFGAQNVNLHRMSDAKDFHLDKLVHKSFIIVDDKGALVSGRRLEAIREVKAPESFIADHPFAFFIVDEKTCAIIFMGFFGSPEQTYNVYTEQDLTGEQIKELLASVHL